MAKVSVYVTSELKAKMDEYPDVNWSDLAQTAWWSYIDNFPSITPKPSKKDTQNDRIETISKLR